MYDQVVFPSYLDFVSMNDLASSGSSMAFDNAKLRIGFTIKKRLPNTETEGLTPTYDVLLPYDNTFIMARGCRPMSLLGSIADHSHLEYRTPDNYNGRLDEQALKQCSRVLVLFLNGRMTDPIILGALQHPLKEGVSRETAIPLKIDLNGVQVSIDNDGQFRLQYNSKTNFDGTPANEDSNSQGGSYVLLDSQGNIKVSTGGDNPQSITLNSDGSIATTAQESITVQAKTLNSTYSESAKIDTPKLTVGNGGQKMVKGTTYRQAESQMLQVVKQAIETAGTQLTLQGTILNALSSALGLGPTGGAPVTAAGSALASAAVAIADFEAKSSQYLAEHELD